MVYCNNNVNGDIPFVIKFSLKKCWLSSVYHKDHRRYLTIILSYCAFTNLQLYGLIAGFSLFNIKSENLKC